MTLTKDDLIKEVNFKTSRSGGKGGQNVNKVSTKVEVVFNISKSLLFTEAEKLILTEKLAARLDSDGNMHVVSQAHRSQLDNKEDAITKTIKILTKLLQVPKKRKPTKVPKSIIAKRLAGKSIRSIKKESRKRPIID
ncbi:MAG: alternative ribosome rescue aminoacyl-tRNA hydrolase ArfB [Bacteroidia bacterium]